MPDPQRFDFDAFDRAQGGGGDSFDFDAFDKRTRPTLLDRLVTPLTDKISKGAKYYADKLNAQATSAGPSWADTALHYLTKPLSVVGFDTPNEGGAARGLVSGALEGAGKYAESMTSPAGIAITVGSLGAGASEAAGLSAASRAALRVIEAAGSAIQGAHGVQTIANAKDAGEGWLGAAEAAGGALGVGSGLRGLRAAMKKAVPRPRIAPGATAGEYAAETPGGRTPYVRPDLPDVPYTRGKRGSVQVKPDYYTDANAPDLPAPVTRAVSRVSGPNPPRPTDVTVEPTNWWTSDEPAGSGPLTTRDQIAGIDPRRVLPRTPASDIVNRNFRFQGRNAAPLGGDVAPASTAAVPGVEKLDLGINGTQEPLPYPFGKSAGVDAIPDAPAAPPMSDVDIARAQLLKNSPIAQRILANREAPTSAGRSARDLPRSSDAEMQARMEALGPAKYVAPLPDVPPQPERSGFAGLRDELKRMGLLPKDAEEPSFGGGSAESLDPGQPRTPWPGERRVLPREADAPVVPKAIRDLHESLKPKWAKTVADQAGDGIPFTVDPSEDIGSFANRVQHDPVESLMGAERKVRKGLDSEAGFIDPSIAKDLPGLYERAAYGGMLSGGGTQLRNLEGGASAVLGRGLEDTLSTVFGGPHGNRGGRAIAEYFNPRKALPRLWEAFQHPPDISGKGLPTGTGDVLNLPGRAMHAPDQMGKEALMAAGHSPESAADVMLTGPARSDLGKAVQNFHAQSGPLGRMLFPFVRTGTNLVERGLERTPLIGAVASKLMDPDVPWADVVARQVLGSGASVGGYYYGKKTGKTLSPNLAAGLGAYGVPAQIAAALGAGRAHRQPARATVIEAVKSALQSSPLPMDQYSMNRMLDPSEYVARVVPNALRDVGELIPGVEPSRFDPTSAPYPFGKAIQNTPGANRALLKRTAAKKTANTPSAFDFLSFDRTHAPTARPAAPTFDFAAFDRAHK